MSAQPPLTPRKNAQGLPPTYLLHLRALVRQFLSQQLAPPDEGLPGPSNRNQVPDRPLWSPDRLAEVEQAVWSAILKDGGDGKDGLLGFDWDQWAIGSRLRKTAWKKEQSVLEKAAKAAGRGTEHISAEGVVRGLALRLPGVALLPSALSSATSTPTKGLRSPSVASSIHSRERSGRTDTGNTRTQPDSSTDDHNSVDDLAIWCERVRELAGFLPYTKSSKEAWAVLNSKSPRRGPAREVPGAFPQTQSSYASSYTCDTSVDSLVPQSLSPVTKELLPALLKPVICLSFASTPPSYSSGSTRSQATIRSVREGSSEPGGATSSRTLSRHGSMSKTHAAGAGSGSGGLGSLGGWFGNKWSELTVAAEEAKVEIEFVAGQFALPVSESRLPRENSGTLRGKGKIKDQADDSDVGSESGADDAATDQSHESAWSGTEKGGEDDGTVTRHQAENVIVAGMAMDIPIVAAGRGEVGVVGGTIAIRGMKREEERRGIERVFKAIIYTIQSHAFELSLLDAFSIPREPDPPIAPQPPLKTDNQRTRTTSDMARPTRPGLSRANSSGQGRKGFFAKLGLGPSEPGKGVGRGMWDGLMGKRRSSQVLHSSGGSDMKGIDEVGEGGGLHRKSSVSSAYKSDGTAYPTISRPNNPVFYLPPPTPQVQNHQMGGIERHLYLLAQLRSMIHSTTPGLLFPLPGILLRVEEEDRVRREKAGEEIKAQAQGLSSGASTPRPTWTNAGSPPGLRARTASMASISARGLTSAFSNSTSCSTTSSGTGIDGLPVGPPMPTSHRAEEVRGRALGYRLGGDIRSGLTSLAVNLDGWEGWCRLQRIEYVFWICVEEASGSEEGHKTLIACTKPVNSLHRYFDPESDVSIEDYLTELADDLGISADERSPKANLDLGEQLGDPASSIPAETDSEKEEGLSLSPQKVIEPRQGSDHSLDESGSWEPVCSRPECGIAERDHLRIWASGSRRVVGRIVKTVREVEKHALGPDVILAQVRCDMCGAESGWRRVENVQGASWNKFMELIMYTTNFVSPTLCSHASASNHSTNVDSFTPPNYNFTYLFSTPAITLALTSESQSVLDTRLPKLQVGPLVAKRKTGNDAAKSACEAFSSTTRAASACTAGDDSPIDPAGAKIMMLPGSSVSVREDEPASIIAYSLSSLAYFNELCGGSDKGLDSQPDHYSSSDNPGSENRAATDDKWKIVVSRKDTPRDHHPLRVLTKKRSEISLPSSARLPLSVTPNTPSLELNLQPVSGLTGSRDGGGMDDLVKSISRATAYNPVLTTSSNTSLSLSPSNIIPRPVSTEPIPSSLILPDSASGASLSESELSIDGEKRHTPRIRKRLTNDAPPSSYRRTVSASVSMDSSPRSTSSIVIGASTPPRSSRDKENQFIVRPSPGPTAMSSLAYATDKDKEGWGGSVTSSFASSFNTLLKLGTDVTDSLTARVRSGGPGEPSRSLASIMNPLHHSSSEPSAPDDTRPHIHLELSHPNYKIGCTVYFASAFDTLRRRCAFDRSFVRSLERSVGWMAEGGKSKANFWKTEDGRLVVKSLVTKWNVSDLQALLEIAPAYFEHMSNTHNKATALAKIVGFYTVKIHDLQTNEKRSLDLLVMENLFWKQEIDRTFDLKGIEARRVPKGKENETTMFDAEWLDSQAASPLFVHPHAKRILLDSLSTDTRFLSNQSIVDYSLLLGLDRARSELVVGLVDAVGSYGLLKGIESMGKIALNRGREGDVTIIPPDQYRERFETALRSYFFTCPDKWSRSAKRPGHCPSDLSVVF